MSVPSGATSPGGHRLQEKANAASPQGHSPEVLPAPHGPRGNWVLSPRQSDPGDSIKVNITTTVPRVMQSQQLYSEGVFGSLARAMDRAPEGAKYCLNLAILTRIQCRKTGRGAASFFTGPDFIEAKKMATTMSLNRTRARGQSGEVVEKRLPGAIHERGKSETAGFKLLVPYIFHLFINTRSRLISFIHSILHYSYLREREHVI